MPRGAKGKEYQEKRTPREMNAKRKGTPGERNAKRTLREHQEMAARCCSCKGRSASVFA